MNHCLVIPQDLLDKLNNAQNNQQTLAKWNAIGINNVDEMIQRIIHDLNKKESKLSITSFRVESNNDIKIKIENSGTASKFAGYFEDENMNVDALFFYIEPDVNSANDFLSRYVMPVIIGIRKSINNRTKDLHINNMPVYIVSLCSTSRIGNDSVKRTIICAETIGFEYVDVFKNSYKEIINRLDVNGNPITRICTLQEFNDFLTCNGNNEYFDFDVNTHSVTILTNRLVANNSNITAELYRYVLRIIPAVYMASSEGFTIDTTNLAAFTNDGVVFIKNYIESF